MKTQRPITTTTALYSCGCLTALLAGLAFAASAPRALVDDCDIHVKAGDDLHITTNTTADCMHVEVDGRLFIWNTTLTLTGKDNHDTSIVDGQVFLKTSSSRLHIKKSDHTLSGSGRLDGQNDAAQITLAAQRVLTNKIKIEGNLQIRSSVGGTGTKFTNGSGGVVEANNAGTLAINPNTLGAGAGAFKVTSSASAILLFSKGSTSLTGDFTVSNGALDINENVTTTGDLTFTGGRIDVQSGATFSAKVSSP